MLPVIGLVSGFLTGLAGSAHCVGTCSGIATALLLTRSEGGRSSLSHQCQLHGGRLVTYAAGGALAGTAGVALGLLFQFAGLNFALRLAAMVVMALTGLSIAGFLPSPRFLESIRFPGQWIRNTFPSPPPFVSGLCWGLMPCGMVYLALINAAFSGTAFGGMAYMTAFALGTVPAVALSSTAAAFVTARGKTSHFASAQKPGSWLFNKRGLGLLVFCLALLSILMPAASLADRLCSGV